MCHRRPIETALCAVTEILGRELAAPTSQAPPWGEFEWRIARAVATMQGISSLLLTGMRWKGPANWQQFLEEQHSHVAGRHRRIAQLLDRIDALATRENIVLVPLKGAALHAIGIYQIGERPMADVDLLARETDVKATTRLLEECDFTGTFSSWRDQLFEPRATAAPAGFGENIDNPIKVELHTRIRERLPLSETDITQFLFATCGHPRLKQLSLDRLPHDAFITTRSGEHACPCTEAHPVA